MFTGIVAQQLTIRRITPSADGLTVEFDLPQWGSVTTGESILLHGICSTVVSVTATAFAVNYMTETIHVTTVKQWRVGQTIHAEPSVTPTTRLSGSFVFGHVDVVLPVVAIQPLTITIPAPYQAYVFPKGSLTLDGVNLTIASYVDQQVTVALISETRQRTSLEQRQVGERVNVEFDYLAKTVTAALAAHPASLGQ